MIIEAIFDLIKVPLVWVFSNLPTLDFLSLPSGFINWIIDLFSLVAYFVPIPDFLAMLGISILITNFQVVKNIILRVWEALPFN